MDRTELLEIIDETLAKAPGPDITQGEFEEFKGTLPDEHVSAELLRDFVLGKYLVWEAQREEPVIPYRPLGRV